MYFKALTILPKVRLRDVAAKLRYPVAYQSASEIVFRVKERSYLIIYSFGVCVFANLSSRIENNLRKSLDFFVADAVEELYDVILKPEVAEKVEHDRVTLRSVSLEKVRIISLIMAESVAIEDYMLKASTVLDKALIYSKGLETKGLYPTSQKELLRFIGFSLTTRQNILNNLYITDYPDEIWDDIELESFYKKIKDMFDIEARFRSLNTMLSAIQDSIVIFVDLLQNKKSHQLEWLIVALIGVEIVISLVERIFS